jgi:hypothetical protein
MRWKEHVVGIAETKNAYKILLEKSGGEQQFRYSGMDGRIILKLSLQVRYENV